MYEYPLRVWEFPPYARRLAWGNPTVFCQKLPMSQCQVLRRSPQIRHLPTRRVGSFLFPMPGTCGPLKAEPSQDNLYMYTD